MVFDESVLTRNGLKLLLYYNDDDDDGVVWRTFRRAVPGIAGGRGFEKRGSRRPIPGGLLKGPDYHFRESLQKQRLMMLRRLTRRKPTTTTVVAHSAGST